MKTIIVATDFSHNADNAISYAGSLAAFTGAKIVLFNAYQVPVHASNTLLSPNAIDELFEANELRLKKLALGVSKKYNVSVDGIAKLAVLSKALESLVPQLEADLVVMGVHSCSWDDQVFGNNTTAIIRTANYPVLIVPNCASFNGIDKILYAYDSKCEKGCNRFPLLKELANRFGAELQVFHVEKIRKNIVDNKEVAMLAQSTGLAMAEVAHSYKELEEETVIKGIERGVREFEPNLLVMVPHKLTFTEGLLNKSKTRSMALKTSVPLLVLPNNEQ